MIQVQEMTKRYGSAVAVDGISFEVDKGKIVGFLGPNGAGKTTTMRVLTCFLPQTEGKASVAGFDVLEEPLEVKKRVGYLPETPPLYPEMDVQQYLQFAGTIKGVSSKDLPSRIDYVLERTSTADVRRKEIAKLSKGYRQRVGLAQALIHDPEVLILDEPTSGLDPKQINETRDLIRQLAGDHTVVLSTHILPEVEQICEEVIIISQGRIQAKDSVENLRTRLRSSDTVYLELGGEGVSLDPEAIANKLREAQWISSVGRRPDHHGNLAFEIGSAPDENIRPALAGLAVGEGWPVQELRSVSVSLEDIFLQLTQTDEPEAPQEQEEKAEEGGAE